MGMRSHTRVAVLAVLVLLVGLTAGLHSALAESPSPAASTDKVTLRIGTTGDADTLNPFTMLGDYVVRGDDPHLQPALRPGPGGQAARLRGGGGPHPGERRPVGRRQDVDDQTEAGPQVERR